MKHLTIEQIQNYADGTIDLQEKEDFENHIYLCSACSANLKSFQQMEMSIKRIPLEEINPKFTQQIMRRLDIRELPPLIWTISKNLAPILGIIMVIGVVYGSLKYTGVLDSSNIGESLSATKSAYESVSSKLSESITAFTSWIKNTFPFFYSNQNYGLTAFLLILFIVVAILDKFVFIPMFRRRI